LLEERTEVVHGPTDAASHDLVVDVFVQMNENVVQPGMSRWS
jgi:hypothetical protein